MDFKVKHQKVKNQKILVVVKVSKYYFKIHSYLEVFSRIKLTCICPTILISFNPEFHPMARSDLKDNYPKAIYLNL